MNIGSGSAPTQVTVASKAQTLLENNVVRLGTLVDRLGGKLAPYGDNRPSPSEKLFPEDVDYWPPYFQEMREQLGKMEMSMNTIEELLSKTGL